MKNNAKLAFSTFGKRDILPEKRIDRITIRECGEPLVELKLPNVVVCKTPRRIEFDQNDVLYARQEIVRRLAKVGSALPSGLGFKVFDAYRPYEFQQMLFDEEYAKTKAANPKLNEVEIRKIVFNSVFPPSMDSQKPAPHLTGGAIDLTLVNHYGQELDMGCGYCEFGETMYTNAPVGLQARQNRLILLNAMVDAGFANFPGEYWHFMYGEREWAAYMALVTGSPSTAMYGGILNPPPAAR